MNILHIAHYDMNIPTQEHFTQHVTNGLERFLKSHVFFQNDSVTQYIVFFNEQLQAVQVFSYTADGTLTFYISYTNIEFNRKGLSSLMHELIDKLYISLVHFHYQHPFVLEMAGDVDTDVPFIATIHDMSYLGEHFGATKEYVQRELVAQFFNKMVQVIFPHRRIAEAYRQIYPQLEKKYLIIPNGVSLPHVAQLNENDGRLKVVFLGGFNQYKGSDIIAEVVGSTSKDIDYYLVGMIENATEFKETHSFNDMTIAETVQGINPDVIAIPSIVPEAFSYTAMEATALGYPVVAFATGALQDVAKEGRGYVVEEITSRAFSEMLLELSKEKNSGKQSRVTLFHQIQNWPVFSEQQMVDAYLGVYHKFAKRVEVHPIDPVYIANQNARSTRMLLHTDLDIVEEMKRIKHENVLLFEQVSHFKQQFETVKRHPLRTFFGNILRKIGVR